MNKAIWFFPDFCDPPHRVARPEQVDDLAEKLEEGWDRGCPALVGYPVLDQRGIRIQLLSGSHRWAAANRVWTMLPVVIVQFSEVDECWGTDRWFDLMKKGDTWE